MSNAELSKELSVLVVERLQKEGKTYSDAVLVVYDILLIILHCASDLSHLSFKETATDFFKVAIEDLEDE